MLSAPLDTFKEREIEIVGLMAEGLSNREIGERLFITTETVRWYNKQIYSKLGTSRRTEAIALARKMGLIDGQESDPPSYTARPKLPITTGPFIGRNDEMSELVELLGQSTIRLISIVAVGGMGKSRLSLELAHLVKDQLQDAAAFIDLASITNPNDIAAAAVTTLGLTIRGRQSPKQRLFDFCRNKEMLLIFDNFEHLLPGTSLLAELLEAAPDIQLIVTTRERLNLRVETVFQLLPVMKSGAALFIEVAQMMHPLFKAAQKDVAKIQRIVDSVGGLPLALILAASWLDTLTINEIADEIASNLNFLSSEMQDMPQRQQSIHAVVDPTWKRLSEKEQKAFMWSSLFRGGFSRESFQLVTGTSVRTLQTLINRSLINHGHGRRYDMHPLLRQYAREKLDAAGTFIEARKSHLDAFLHYAQTHADRMFDGQSYLKSLEALDVEQDNFRAALDWSMLGNSIDHGVALILANCELWLARSRARGAMTYIEQAIQQFEHPKLHYWRSVYLDRLGQIEQSIESASYVIEYSEKKQDHELLAYGQMQLSMLKNTKSEARPLLESALSNALKTDNKHLIANCHSTLALVCSKSNVEQHLEGDANTHHQKALEIFEMLGDLRGISRVTNNVALNYYDSIERKSEAKELMEKSLQLKRNIGDLAGEARRLTTLSLWAIEEEEFELARERLAASRKICEELGEMDRLSYTLTTEGLLHLLMMEFERAQAILERSLQVHTEIKDYKGIVDIYGLLGQLYILQKKLADARLMIAKGIAVGMKEYSLPSILIIAYANYLWQKDDPESLKIIATLAQQKLNVYSVGPTIVNSYFLQPLIYRAQQHISGEAWQHALNQTANITVEQAFEKIAHEM